MPTGVLMPVANMSIRVLIGMVQALVRPGNRMAASKARVRLSRSTPSRHWSSGFKMIVVSIIESGAGSVAVSARPTLPNTRSTSGKEARMRSVRCRISPASRGETPGSVVGM